MSDDQMSPQAEAEFNQYWPKFVVSKQYRSLEIPEDLKDVPAMVLQGHFSSMDELSVLAPNQWQLVDIQASVEEFVNEMPQDDLSAIVTMTGLLTLQQFLDWLEATHQLSLPQDKIEEIMLQAMTRASTELPPDDLSLDNAVQPADEFALAAANEARSYQPDDEAHVDTFDGRKWRSATAKRVHKKMFKHARLLWADEVSDDVAAVWTLPEIANALVTLGDAMYAQYLETPKTWQADHFHQYLMHAMDHQSLINFDTVLVGGKVLLQYLSKTKKLQQEQADQLMDALADVTSYLDGSSGKPALRPHRKQKKHKKPKKKKQWKR